VHLTVLPLIGTRVQGALSVTQGITIILVMAPKGDPLVTLTFLWNSSSPTTHVVILIICSSVLILESQHFSPTT